MDKKKIWESYRFPLILLAGIITGAILGLVLGEKATILAPLGDIFINLMFTIVVPMVFVSITNAVGSMLNMKRLGKILGSLVLTFVITGLFAAALVLVVVNIWPPAANTAITMGSAEMGETASISSMIVSLFGFPGEAFPLIATIGFLVDPAANCLNASGDTIASMIIARIVEGKDWLTKKPI